MHVNVVTDQMLGKILGAAVSPVFVEWFRLTDSLVCDRRVLERLIVEFDDRMIFIRVGVDENPDAADAAGMPYGGFQIYHGGKPVGRSQGAPVELIYRDAIEACLEGRNR